MKKIKPAPLASIVVALFLLISSLYYLIIQSEEIPLVPFWEGGLVVCIVLIFASALALNREATDRTRVAWTRSRFLPLAADLVYFLAAFLLIFSGRIRPDLEFEFLGLSAVFTYDLVLPFLVLLASFLVIKDSINLLYGYRIGGFETEEAAQRAEVAAGVVHDPGILLEDPVVSLSSRLLQQRYGFGGEQVLFRILPLIVQTAGV